MGSFDAIDLCDRLSDLLTAALPSRRGGAEGAPAEVQRAPAAGMPVGLPPAAVDGGALALRSVGDGRAGRHRQGRRRRWRGVLFDPRVAGADLGRVRGCPCVLSKFIFSVSRVVTGCRGQCGRLRRYARNAAA